MKRSETSSRLLFNPKSTKQLDSSTSHQSLASSLNSSGTDVSSISLFDEITPDSPSSDSQNSNFAKSESSEEPPRIKKKKSGLPIKPEDTIDDANRSVDKRAATYKYARGNLSETVNNNRSKVGSMILEFDALAHKLEDTTSDESNAWLLLDNKTLPRHYNNSIQQLNSRHHPSVSHLFPSTSSKPPVTPETTTSSMVTNSYAYQSLSKKDGSRLASIMTSNTTDESFKRGRDRNSPYYYVERLRSRNTTVDGLTKHLTSLRITLATGNVSWINEFLSRRHGGLVALENVLEKFITKKSKQVYIFFILFIYLINMFIF
ncbi:hypothetical protein EDC94DRAFT_526795 [Helicostylum pulchrum]|nr:hypothetical protein EDC94DRAFT_526795 [Helicostylum pulchrum]